MKDLSTLDLPELRRLAGAARGRARAADTACANQSPAHAACWRTDECLIAERHRRICGEYLAEIARRAST
jgi:hypothetical protein